MTLREERGKQIAEAGKIFKRKQTDRFQELLRDLCSGIEEPIASAVAVLVCPCVMP